MKSPILCALLLSLAAAAALCAADEEPQIRPDPRPTDLTTGKRGSNDEPTIRSDPRALDLSTPKQSTGRSMIEPSHSTTEIDGLTVEQSNQIRAIRQRADADVQAVRDRERAEVMMVLNEQQRAQLLKREGEAKTATVRRVTTAPATSTAS